VELANAGECLGTRYGWDTARPVYRTPGGDWARTGPGAYRGTARRGAFAFTVPVGRGPVEVAYCYPYTVSDLDAYLHHLAGRPAARVEALARSAAGRPVPLVTAGNPGAPVAWVLARQHAGETPASFAIEGMLDWLTGESAAARAARDAASFRVAPMVDPDGVFAGRFGKDGPPVDFNRDWRARPRRPEIAALAAAVTAGAPPALLLDLHASHHGNTSCYLFGPALESAADAGRTARFLALLEAESPPAVGFRRGDLRAEPPPAGSARAFFARRGALALCVELSYHLAQSGRYLTPTDYRDFGAALARAAARYLAPGD
jgi:predicted deacylase